MRMLLILPVAEASILFSMFHRSTTKSQLGAVWDLHYRNPSHLTDSLEYPRFEWKLRAWWVKDNVEKDSVAPLTSTLPRKSPRSQIPRGGISTLTQRSRWAVNLEGTKRVTVGLNQGGHSGVEHVKNVARGPSQDNGGTVSNGTSSSRQVKLTVGQTHSYPVRAVSNPAVSPILAQRVIALAPPEVAPVT
ncbi:hypothetical protein L873DRAFT_1847718 [Choiromyces venosus 120613-1]|uniref:Uncharacterized protein n=1 Tax=Choiromyces venosus 120613-1 TaxID=1336337 RepID=A0A3N4J2W9_9PEZI|nr:hypothetical protein L873DRAFT_1847718 [Choiromyces venosus 120613-1]